jgi:hypothetical protein
MPGFSDHGKTRLGENPDLIRQIAAGGVSPWGSGGVGYGRRLPDSPGVL